MKNDDLYNNLVTLLKMFKNRPHHLAKYFIENSSLDKDFIRKIAENGKLKNLSNNEENMNPIYFSDINKMNDYYNSFVEDIENILKNKTPNEIELELNEKLDNFILNEKYEDAARLRDYMYRININRKKNK